MIGERQTSVNPTTRRVPLVQRLVLAANSSDRHVRERGNSFLQRHDLRQNDDVSYAFLGIALPTTAVPLFRPSKLQDAQARIFVSRDEQVKTLKRLRRAEKHRREGLQRSIEAKNNLAERIKATKSINSKAVVSSRLRCDVLPTAVRRTYYSLPYTASAVTSCGPPA